MRFCPMCGEQHPADEMLAHALAAHPGEDGFDFVWLGDLAGCHILAESSSVYAGHRCGWEERVPDSDAYAGNIVLRLLAHRAATCRA